MPYVQPNSTVWVYKGIPLDKSYNHTIEFPNVETQRTYFTGVLASSGNLVKTFAPHTYQRMHLNKVRVNCNANELLDVNYMVFRNIRSVGTSKEFYCFIDNVEYVNENCTEISYTIDVMQTYYFDYDLGACFVEREHTETDGIGENIVPENLEIGESVVAEIKEVQFPIMLGALVTSKPLPDKVTGYYVVGSPAATPYAKVVPTWSPETKEAPSGIPNQLYYYTGFPISHEDVIDFWQYNYTGYQMQDYVLYFQGDLPTPIEYNNFATLGFILGAIGNGAVQDFSINDVVDCYMYPADLNKKTNLVYADAQGYRSGIAFDEYDAPTRPTKFTHNGTEYVPVNNKVYTYPYVSLFMSNNAGNTAEFRYENFENGAEPLFGFVGNYTSSPTIMLYPRKHRDVAYDYDAGLTLAKFPQPAYMGSQFVSWLEQNKNSVAMSMLTSAVMGGLNVGVGMVHKNPVSVAEGAIGTASQIGGTLAKMQDLKNAPPQVQSQIVSDSIATGLNRTGYRLFAMCIKPEFAEIVDNYFNMFGYAINKVKVPNIKKEGATLRPYWNYIKTQGCIIHPARGTNTGLPSDAEAQIAKIFDRGITFWSWEISSLSLGDYTLDNKPV